MPEKDIQKYEHLDEAGMGSVFFADGVSGCAQHFVALMRSYRIAANVACSAWKLVDEMERNSGVFSIDTLEELRARLRLFAPEAPAFRQPKPVREYACRLLEELYDALSPYNDPTYNTGIMLEQLFRRIEEMRKELTE